MGNESAPYILFIKRPKKVTLFLFLESDSDCCTVL